MSPVLAGLCVLAGVIVLAVGGELLVKGAGRVGLGLGLSPAVVGLTIVSVATSAPEFAVAIDAVLEGRDAVAVGNVVGSNIANIWLVLGGAALIAAIPATRSALRRDIPVIAAMTLLLVALAFDGRVSRIDGLMLVLAMGAVMITSVRSERRSQPQPVDSPAAAPPPDHPRSVLGAWLAVIGGVALLGGGAHLLVLGASRIAAVLGWSELTIGLTVVAIGTSLPELTTSVMAGLRGQHELGLGNALGSNVANIGLVLGLTALVCGGIAVPTQAVRTDLPLSLFALGCLALLLVRHGQLTRLAGVSLLGCFALYLASLVWGGFGSATAKGPLLAAAALVLATGAFAVVRPSRRRT